jgi:hypothetical protein
MTTNLDEVIHFETCPDEMWGSYALPTRIADDGSITADLVINGTTLESLEFVFGSLWDTTRRFRREVADEPEVSFAGTLMKGAFDALLAKWEIEDSVA